MLAMLVEKTASTFALSFSLSLSLSLGNASYSSPNRVSPPSERAEVPEINVPPSQKLTVKMSCVRSYAIYMLIHLVLPYSCPKVLFEFIQRCAIILCHQYTMLSSCYPTRKQTLYISAGILVCPTYLVSISTRLIRGTQ